MKKILGICFDVETTGFDMAGGDILSTGLTEVYDDFTIGKTGYYLSRPTSAKYFTEDAVKVHGFSYWKALEHPTQEQAAINILNFLKPHIESFPLYFFDFSTNKFDFRWLEWMFRKLNMLGSFNRAFNKDKYESVQRLAKREIFSLPNYKLDEVCRFYDIQLEHHNAKSDSRAAAEIYCNIKKGIGLETLGLR